MFCTRLRLMCCPGSQNSVGHLCKRYGAKVTDAPPGSCDIVVDIEAPSSKELDDKVFDISHLADVKKVSAVPTRMPMHQHTGICQAFGGCPEDQTRHF